MLDTALCTVDKAGHLLSVDYGCVHYGCGHYGCVTYSLGFSVSRSRICVEYEHLPFFG